MKKNNPYICLALKSKRMRKLSLIFLISFFSIVWAQRSKITSASLAIQDGDYETAIVKLKEALQRPELLKPNDFAKAYTKLVTAYLYYYQKNQRKAFEKYPNLAEDAYNAYKKAQEYDRTKKYKKELDPLRTALANVLYLRGVDYFEKQRFKDARQLIENALTIYGKDGVKDFYAAHLLYAYTLMAEKDTAKAMTEIQKGIELYKTQPPKQKDPFVAHAYATLIQYYAQQPEKRKEALNLIDEAKRLFPNNPSIKNAELQLLLNPEMYEIALQRYKDEVEKNPKDIINLLVYAQLLEKKNPEEAVVYYKRALEIDPDHLQALYNTGALYINMGVEKNRASIKEEDANKSEALRKEAENYFRQALPYMERTLELLDNNAQGEQNDNFRMNVLRALVQITGYLGLDDKYQQYKTRLDQMKN